MMEARNVDERGASAERAAGRLPRPPELVQRDVVNDLGWLSRGPARRADGEAAANIESLLLRSDEDSGLPPDPQEAPPLPEPPSPVFPDTETKGSKPDGVRRG